MYKNMKLEIMLVEESTKTNAILTEGTVFVSINVIKALLERKCLSLDLTLNTLF